MSELSFIGCRHEQYAKTSPSLTTCLVGQPRANASGTKTTQTPHTIIVWGLKVRPTFGDSCRA